MAGIGFRLKKILDQDSYISVIKAYLYSALISSGPWLITILVIGLLGIIQSGVIPIEKSNIFRITIVYVYAFSLIVVGIIQMPLTRYLSDLLFSRDTKMYLPAYSAVLILTGIVQSIQAIPACFIFSGWNRIYAVHTYTLYIVVSFIWIAMIFLSTARNYTAISLAFIIGGGVSIGAGYFLGKSMGLNGYMIGFTAGQVLLFIILSARIVIEFPSEIPISFDFLKHLNKYPALILCGLFYNLGIWIDKFIFWFSPTGVKVSGFLHANFVYDSPMYISFLTIVPALSLFLIRVETSFHDAYQQYYSAVVGKQSLQTIMKMKKNMVERIKLSIVRFLKIQGIITIASILAIPYLVEYFNLNWFSLNIMRIGTFGAFLHVLFLFQTICLLYFEFRTEVAGLCIMFFTSNAVFSLITLRLGPAFYGYGYFTACFVTLAAGTIVMDYKIRDLEYITFIHQPVTS